MNKTNNIDMNKNNEVKVKDLKRTYDANFVPSQAYLDSMPDLQNSKFEGIPIEFVGIQNYQIPITIKQRDGGTQQVLASLYGEVDCDSDAKGINMSRLGGAFSSQKTIFLISIIWKKFLEIIKMISNL